MSPALQSVQLFLLAGALFLGIGSLASALLARAVGAAISRREPKTRHRALALLAGTPVLTAFVLLVAVSLPSFIALFAPGFDHCAAHDDHHSHLCFIHLPEVRTGVAVTLGLVFVASYAALRAVLSAVGTWRTLRVLGALTRSGQADPDLGVTVIETSQPVCVAAGLFRPRVLLSRGLLATLGAEERAIVLAHERAHVRRRDALVAGVVNALSVVHLPAVAAWLIQEIEIAAEQACDEEAAALSGDRVAVAATILKVERAVQHSAAGHWAPGAVAFGASAVERRVQSLLAAPGSPESLRRVALALVLVLVGVFVAADELHHATESLLSIIAH